MAGIPLEEYPPPKKIKIVLGLPTASPGHGLVWVNTETHIYHRKGSHLYGRTKKGKYMTEQKAIQTGNKAAAKGE